MPDSKDEKSLEMRIAELEDKLKGMEVTEEEMAAYNKVAGMMASGPVAAGASAELTPAPGNCVISQCVRPCVVNQCIRACTVVSPCTIRACTVVSQCTVVNQCIRACTIIQDCINECGGGCAPGGGGFSSGGFGTLGG